MPFGLCNTPATFQRLMQNCLDELNLMYCLIYLDDVIVFSKTVEEHLQCLCIVFRCFREHNLKLKLSKYEFLRNEIKYLVHHISKEGIRCSKVNLKALGEFAPPQTYTEIQAFFQLGGTLPMIYQGVCTSHNPCMSICLEKVSAKRMSE